MNLGKGLIGITASERNNFSWDFIKCLLELKHATGAGVAYSQLGTIDLARNEILLMALKYECDWVVMVDSDMTFPKDGVHKLLETMKKNGADMGAGLYFKGSKPFDPVAFDYVDGAYIPIKEWDKTREIMGCGMGFTIIRKNLFGFKFAFTKHNNKLLGEDITFCKQVTDAEKKIVLDPSVKCGHLRLIEINEDYIKKCV